MSRWIKQVYAVSKGFHIPEDVTKDVVTKVMNDKRPIPRYYKHAVAACKYDRAIRLLRSYM